MLRRLSLYSLPLLSAAFLSCGEGSNLPSAQTDPCSLITGEEAERALGERVQAPALSDPNTCVFKASRNNSNAVTVQVDEAPGKDRRTWFNKERLRRDSDLIPGLADGAVRIYSPPSLARLTFIRGESLVTVMVSSMTHKDLQESVMLLGKTAAERYGTSTFMAAGTATPPPGLSRSSLSDSSVTAAAAPRTSPTTMTQTLPASSAAATGPVKSRPIDQADLVGTWHAHSLQGATRHELLLVIQPNQTWSLSSMMQFDGVLNAETGRWSLERANTFKGLAWNGTYQGTTAASFSTTGSIHATWSRLQADQIPPHIPAELWQLRREATSVPVFQLKTVDPALVGQWEGTGTYGGTSAFFVWSIKPSAASDLVIVETTSGTVGTKAGIHQLQPTQKKQRSIGIVAFQDSGFTTSDGKTSIRWTRLMPEPAQNNQL